MAEELIKIPGRWDIRYEYAAGRVASEFFRQLKENKKVLGIRSPQGGRVMVPPRSFDERTFTPATEWVEVGPEGTIEAFTIVHEAFEGLPPPPYAIAYVRLDGADTAMVNFVDGVDLSDVKRAVEQLKVGTRVRVVFKKRRKGRITDFRYQLVSSLSP